MMPNDQLDRAELCATLTERILAALDGSSRPWPSADVWPGNVIEHARAAVARAVSQALAEEQWLYFCIRADVTRGRSLLVHEIAPMMRDVGTTQPVKGWWWLYKRDVNGPAIRLRVFVPLDARQRIADAVGAALTARGLEFTMPCYEPELLLFGGSHGMRAAHEFFCADSAFLASWAERDASPRGSLIPEGLSLALTMRLLQAAGLDLFERWDVFHGVAQKRAFGNRSDKRFQRYEEFAGRVVSAGPDQILQLYLKDGNPLLAEHVAFLDAFGLKLSAWYIGGLLECGLREFFVPIILFHWNRLLLSPFAHFGLSHAVAQALWRASREGQGAAMPQE